GEAFGRIEVNRTPRSDTYFQIIELAAGFAASCAQTLDAFRCALQVEREPIPALCETRRSAERRGAMSSEDNFRMRFLHRPGHPIDALDLHPAAGEFWLGHRPQGDHRGEILLGARPLVIERSANRIELGLQVADSDTKDEATAGKDVGGRKLFGENDR